MISRNAIRDYHARKLDSCAWIKKIPREELLKEIKTFKVRPIFRGHDRWTHQLASFLIGMSYPQYLFLLDMGLGKTTILLDLFTQHLREKTMTRGLVLVPRLINISTWNQDVLEHSDFEPNLCYGDIEEKWERLINPRGDLSIIDYAGLHLALGTKEGKKIVRDDKKVAKLRKVYDGIALDEIHKTRNKDTLRYSILRALMKTMPVRYGTTGTLFGHDPQEIYPQFYLIDRGETFGDTMGLFREAFFDKKVNPWGGPEYTFRKELTRQLYRMLQHRSLRYDEDEVPEIEIPKGVFRQLKVAFSDEQREHYLRALQGIIDAKGRLSDIDSAWIRMRQITSGYLEWNDEHGKHSVMFPENPKLQMLEKVIDESGYEKVIVSTEYTQTGRLITQWLEKNNYGYEWLYGGTKDPVNCIQRFMRDASKKVFVMNSESGGTGTDGLQKVSRYLVMYESPTTPIARKQLIKRVLRPGQRHRAFIYDIVMEKSLDKGILTHIEEGVSLYKSVVNGKFNKLDFLS